MHVSVGSASGEKMRLYVRVCMYVCVCVCVCVCGVCGVCVLVEFRCRKLNIHLHARKPTKHDKWINISLTGFFDGLAGTFVNFSLSIQK